jgi:NAD(P)-dependent dehydrogenase (short-subunit alcohol dehydrogenase family)
MKRAELPRVVVVTGASAGVGRATARRFAASGADVGLIARDAARLESAAAEVRALGRRAVVAQADVADADAVERAAAHIERELGPIECWVNNAMASVFARVMDVHPEEYRRVTDVTYHGVVHGSQAALRRMIPRNRGVLIQVGSALAFRGIPLQSAYCAAKHAVEGFTESLRTELMHDGLDIHVTLVHLPAINTPQFEWVLSRLPRRAQPVPPIFQPEVAARAIVWSSVHRRRSLLVGFPTFKAVWGNRAAPWYADRYLARHGFEDQQTDEPRRPDRPSNLWGPVPGDFAAHGRFDARAARDSLWTTLSQHRGAVLAAALVAAGVVVGGVALGQRALSRRSGFDGSVSR